MAKIRTRKCGRCGKQQRTGNGYCASCNALRMAESRGRVPEPETEEGQGVRGLVDKTFDLLESEPGTEVTVKGVTIESNEDDTVTFKNLNREQKRKAERLLRNNPTSPSEDRKGA